MGPQDSVDVLLARLRRIETRCRTTRVGIDGNGGAGKSSLARAIESARDDVVVVETDDFYHPASLRTDEIGGRYDWARLRDQVLVPIAHDRPGRYQRYDWDVEALAEWHDVPVGGILIVEGVYSTRAELRDLYDLRVWVDCPEDVRLARGVARDGEEARSRWVDEWMPAEDRYVSEHRPRDFAAVIIDGSGTGR